jgi:hypothetical protein
LRNTVSALTTGTVSSQFAAILTLLHHNPTH